MLTDPHFVNTLSSSKDISDYLQEFSSVVPNNYEIESTEDLIISPT